jgi:hypothetical protein
MYGAHTNATAGLLLLLNGADKMARLSVDIPDELKKELSKLPYGMIKAITICALTDAMRAISGPNRERIIGGIIDRGIKLSDYSKPFREEDNGPERSS